MSHVQYPLPRSRERRGDGKLRSKAEQRTARKRVMTAFKTQFGDAHYRTLRDVQTGTCLVKAGSVLPFGVWAHLLGHAAAYRLTLRSADKMEYVQ